ncbi:MAG TPA: 16S rRNA (guanine(966)-N(2))-methyltransferase RsmD [Candidatus Limnocylindrales bacterium]|nr:16S rRNA (guanine(966)-N(2))-methyltransferase RsmD [Candidatus Limnocylindrales bacterium]
MPDAGRVIAGSARGTRLVAPGEGTRPLADRVKETLFGILAPRLPGARLLDLFAGSGAAGIEALSRGVASAVLVERDRTAVGVIAENLRRARFAAPEARVVRADVLRYLASGAAEDGPFDVVVVDPPYADTGTLERVLELLGGPEAARILAPQATVVAKHFWRDAPPEQVGLLASVRARRFGETSLTFYEIDQAGEGR